MAWLLISGSMVVAPACRANDGLGSPSLGDRIVRRFAYRPAFPGPNPVPNTRPLYLSGYAGARYGPDRVTVPASPYSATSAVVPAQPLPYWKPTARGWRGIFGLEPGLFRP
jgi:hypothetical protein